MTMPVSCGAGGRLLDYIPFYFGTRSPMLYRISTGWSFTHPVEQNHIIYLVTAPRRILDSRLDFVFFDGHALAALSRAFDNLNDLVHIDRDTVRATQWNNTIDDMDRQRRKQAEFLVHRALPWRLIVGIGVFDITAKSRVESILDEFPHRHRPVVAVRRRWYY